MISAMLQEVGGSAKSNHRSVEGTAAPTVSQEQVSDYISPLLPLHEAAIHSNAYELLDPRRQRVTKQYLTTEDTMGDLKHVADVGSPEAVRYLLLTSLETILPRILPHLPEPIQAQCKSPKEAIRLKSGTHTPKSIRRMIEGHQGTTAKSRDGGKREFSPTHHAHLSAAATRRWKRYREEEKPQGKSAFSEQGLANIRARAGRRRRASQETSTSQATSPAQRRTQRG